MGKIIEGIEKKLSQKEEKVTKAVKSESHIVSRNLNI